MFRKLRAAGSRTLRSRRQKPVSVLADQAAPPDGDGSAATAPHLDRYRKLGAQAQALAAKATRARSEPYLVLASSWIALAEELERLTRTSRKR